MIVEKMVAGFAFSETNKLVILIEKNRPDWQKGKLNAVGGHIETYDQTPHHAMWREFKEETGVETDPFAWTNYLQLNGRDWSVEFFCTNLPDESFQSVQSMTDEEVFTCPVLGLPYRVIYNLNWLIPLSRDTELVDKVIVQYA